MPQPPVVRLAAALAQVASQHHMQVSPPEIRLLARAAAQELARTEPAEDIAAPGALLTDRQMQILKLAANGRTNSDIARATGVPISSIGNQMAKIYQLLGATDRTHAVAIAIARRLIVPADVGIPRGRTGKPGPRQHRRAVAS